MDDGTGEEMKSKVIHLATASDYKFRGSFTNIVSDLKTKGLIDYPKPKFVKAAPFLFLE